MEQTIDVTGMNEESSWRIFDVILNHSYISISCFHQMSDVSDEFCKSLIEKYEPVGECKEANRIGVDGNFIIARQWRCQWLCFCS